MDFTAHSFVVPVIIYVLYNLSCGATTQQNPNSYILRIKLLVLSKIFLKRSKFILVRIVRISVFPRIYNSCQEYFVLKWAIIFLWDTCFKQKSIVTISKYSCLKYAM